MIPGYNHNVQYKGKIYHIQTEDSGVQNPHIITLLYFGGNILSRKKTSYEDILKSERLNQVVKEMMQEQHKAMLRDLKTGLVDERIFGDSKPPEEAVAEAPAPVAQPAPVQAQVPPIQPAAAPKPPVAPQRPPAPAQIPAAPRPPVPSAPRPVAAQPPAAQKPVPPRIAPPQVAQPKPAPPRVVAPPPPPPPPPLPTAKLIELSDDVELRDEDIFGADLISDKSLDEVILNYLAQNIEEE